MEVLAFILHAIEPVGASVWPARPQHPFPEPAEPTGLMTLHAFSVSDCYAESSTPRPCLTDVGDAGPWIAHRAVPQRSCSRDLYGRHLYGLCNKMPNTSILWECILERNGRPLRWNEWLRLQRLAP